MRTYKRKTNRALATQEVMQKAANAVMIKAKSLRLAASEAGTSKSTLARFINKLKAKKLLPKVGYIASRQVFTEEQEKT